MTIVELNALMPLMVLALAAVVTLTLAAFVRRPGVIALVSVLGLAAFLGSILALWPMNPVAIGGLLLIDAFALVFWGLLGAATLFVVVFNYACHRQAMESPEETFGLFMLGLLGGCVMAASAHFASLFMGLELLSVSLFILIAWQCRRATSVEAGIKYLVLSGLASGFMLFGMALIYAAAGALSFPALGQIPAMPTGQLWAQAGMVLLLVGVLFKLSLVPFHFWTPDVYQGASLPVTTFLAVVSKGAAVALMIRLLIGMDLLTGTALWQTLAVVAAASMLAGNWLALRQDDLKRLLAYSSVAHMGYLLAALLAGGALGVEAVLYYVVFYLATTLMAFAAVSALQSGSDSGSMPLRQLSGALKRRPLPALVLMLAMFSLAGVPLTAGFVGKFYVLSAGSAAALWWLISLVVVGSAIGLYYYLRVVLTIAGEPRTDFAAQPSAIASSALVLLALAVLYLGILPGPGMELAEIVANTVVPVDTLVADAP